MKKKVFLSYPSESKNIAELLKFYLKAEGIEPTWYDRDEIIASQNIQEQIKKGIKESACCVFLLNDYSVKSTWCMAEVGAFWGADKPIIVYPIEPRCNIPDYLSNLRRAEKNEEVLKSCKEIIEKASKEETSESFPNILKQCGLKNAFRIPIDDEKRGKRVKELVSNERKKTGQKHFFLLASSGFNFLHKSGKVYRGGLGDAIYDDKAMLSVVLESPFSPFAYARALACHEIHHHWDEKVDIYQLEKLDELENVNIQVTEHPVNCSLFFTSEAVFYDPYLWSKPKKSEAVENHFWVFDFERINDGLSDYECYHLLKLHFDFLFKESIPLKDFLGENRESYLNFTKKFSRKMSEKHKGSI
jgi:hypothetical protein